MHRVASHHLVTNILLAGLFVGLAWNAKAANYPPITHGPVPFPSVLAAVYFTYPNTVATGNFNRDKSLDIVYCGAKGFYRLHKPGLASGFISGGRSAGIFQACT